MANPITVPLPADLPTTWVVNDIISPDGTSAGLSEKHGYNYLMTQVNNAQKAAKQLGEAFDDRTTIIGSIPIQTGSVVYNGKPQSPAWANYDPSKLTIGGTTSATNPGTYNATFAPVQGYTWADGTTATKTVQWTIVSATEKAVSVTLLSSGWTNNQQEVNIAGMTSTSNGVFGIASSATSEQLEAYSSAQILVTGQSSGRITVTCFEGAPSVNIPCTFIFII